MNRNLLSENMMRFGTKNLSEGSKRTLTLESIMQTIAENGLRTAVMNRLLTEQSKLDPSIKANLQAQINAFSAAAKKAYPAFPGLTLQDYTRVNSNGDELFGYSINIGPFSGPPKQIELARITATQDLNGTIYMRSFRMSYTVAQQGTDIGYEYANDPTKTKEPTEAAITSTLTLLGKDFYKVGGGDAKFDAISKALQGNLSSYIIRGCMDAFKAIDTYPSSAAGRPNFNKTEGPQAGGKPKGVNPYKKS